MCCLDVMSYMELCVVNIKKKCYFSVELFIDFVPQIPHSPQHMTYAMSSSVANIKKKCSFSVNLFIDFTTNTKFNPTHDICNGYTCRA